MLPYLFPLLKIAFRLFFLLFFLQFLFQIFCCVAFFTIAYLFRCAAAYDVAAFVAAFRSEVNYIVGVFSNVEIVFNDNDCMSSFYKSIEGCQQTLYVVEMKTRCWLVKDEKGRGLSFLSYEIGQFHALVLTS